MESGIRYRKALKRQLMRLVSVDLGDRGYKIASMGAIAAGLIACMTSVGVGTGLILAGATVLAEA